MAVMVLQVKRVGMIWTDKAKGYGYTKTEAQGQWHLAEGEEVKGAPVTTRCGKQIVWEGDLYYYLMYHKSGTIRVRDERYPPSESRSRPVKPEELCPDCFTSCGSPKL